MANNMGNIAAGFMEGMMAANTENRADRRQDIWEKNSAVTNEANQMRLSQMKAEQAAFNTPEAKALRAGKMTAKLNELKLENSKTSLQMQSMEALNGQTQSAAVTNKLVELDNKVADMDGRATTVNAVGSLVGTLASGGQVKDYDQMNKALQDPSMNFLAPHGITLYNPNDPKMEQGLYQFALTGMKLSGINPSKLNPQQFDFEMGKAKETAKALSEAGFISYDPVTGQAIDTVGMFGVTDIKSQIRSGDMQEYASRGQAIVKRSESKFTKDSTTLSSEANWEKKLEPYTTPGGQKMDPTVAKQHYELIGSKIPDDLSKLLATNKQIVDDRKSEKTMQDLDAMTMSIVGGNNDPAVIAKALNGVQYLPKDQQKGATEKIQTAVNANKISDIMVKPVVTSGDIKVLQNIEGTKISQKPEVKKQQKAVRAEMELVTSVDEVAQDVAEAVNKGGLVTGIGANYALGLVAADQQSAAEMWNKMDKYLATGKVTKQQIMNTIGLNSKLGKLVQKYVKDTSGTGVSDTERDFIMSVLAGAKNGNPEEVIKALTSFRDATVEGLQSNVLGNFNVVNTIPATAYEVKELPKSFKSFESYQQELANAPKPVQTNQVPAAAATGGQSTVTATDRGGAVHTYPAKTATMSPEMWTKFIESGGQ